MENNGVAEPSHRPSAMKMILVQCDFNQNVMIKVFNR